MHIRSLTPANFTGAFFAIFHYISEGIPSPMHFLVNNDLSASDLVPKILLPPEKDQVYGNLVDVFRKERLVES